MCNTYLSMFWKDLFGSGVWLKKDLVSLAATLPDKYKVVVCLISTHVQCTMVDPLNPNINIYILHTVIHTFPKVLTRRTCLTISSFFS